MTDTKVSALSTAPGTLLGSGFTYVYIGSTPYKVAFGGVYGAAGLDVNGWIPLSALGNVSYPVTSVAGKVNAVTLVVGDVSGAAPAASPTFTGAVNAFGATTFTVPLAVLGDNSNNVASTAWTTSYFVQAAQLGVTYFADGSDGNAVMDGTNTFSAYSTKTGSRYDLSRDVYFNNLTITGSGQLNSNGFRIFISGICDLSAAASSAITITPTGGSRNGGAGSGSSGGFLSGSVNLGSLMSGVSSAVAAATGGGTSAGGSPGGTSAPASIANGGRNAKGGAGGAGSASAGGTGPAQATTPPSRFSYRWPDPLMRICVTGVTWSAFNGGFCGNNGAGGGGASAGLSGGGGGTGGMGGGVMYVAIRVLKKGAVSNAINADGGFGGAGAAGTATNCGGGGGGTGGGGGVLHLIIGTIIGTGAMTVSANAGASGAGGATGGGSGVNGTGADGAESGVLLLFNVGAGTVTSVSWQAGTTAPGAGNTTPGSPGLSQVTL